MNKDKDLLLKDLCSRLLYGVIGVYKWKGNSSYNRELTGSLYDELSSSWNSTCDSSFTPYLRPMSSMTEEEKKEYHDTLQLTALVDYPTIKSFDWLNKYHFDYRGLIEKGLAIAVTKENNPYIEEDE